MSVEPPRLRVGGWVARLLSPTSWAALRLKTSSMGGLLNMGKYPGMVTILTLAPMARAPARRQRSIFMFASVMTSALRPRTRPS